MTSETKQSTYKECTRCVMDTSDPDIVFDDNGVCNWCLEADERLSSFMLKGTQSEIKLSNLIAAIKSERRGKYDSVVGLSGGVDSSYIAYWAYKAGLNPLTVHFDNGWNSEIAVSNIKNIVDVCGFDLQTYVINWQEFKDLQRSFLKAGVVDIEMLTDHAIMAALRKIMKQHRIKYVLSGANYATEHGLPRSWVWPKNDWRNIRGIHKKFGNSPLKTFPHIGTVEDLIFHGLKLGGKIVQPLDYMSYSKKEAMSILSKELGWRYYGGKHYESLFTKFYQAYILPTKFGIDKRRSHLSCLIRTGEIVKQDALQELTKPLYEEASLREDKAYVCKKLGFSEEEFNALMQDAPHSHAEYPSDKALRLRLVNMARKFLPQRFEPATRA